MSTGALEARLAMNIEQFVANMVAAGNATQNQADRMARLLKSVQTELRQMNAAAAEAAKSPAGLEATAKSMEHVGFATAGAKRELLVLAHEASQGNWTRFGGSLLVLGERTNVMALAFSGAGLAIGIAGAAVAATVAAYAMAERESNRLRDSLTLTGNAAGLTRTVYNAMAQDVAGRASVSISTASTALMALAAAGAVQQANLQRAAVLTSRISALSGQDAEEIAKEIGRAGADVAKFARDHENAWGAISAAQYQSIKAAQEAGRAQEALGIYLDAMNRRLPVMESAWDRLGHSVSDAWVSFQRWLNPSDGERLQKLQRDMSDTFERIATLREKVVAGRATAQETALIPTLTEQLKKLSQEQQALASKEGANSIKANADAREQALRKEASAGLDLIESYARQAKGAEGLKRELDQLARARAAIENPAQKAPGVVDQSAYEAARRQIIEKYADPAIKRANDEIDRLILTQKQEDARIQGQIANLRLYGKAFDDTREAAARMRLTEGGLAGVSQEKKDAYIAGAAQLDQDNRAKVQVEAEMQLRRNIEALRDQAQARQESARAAFVQQMLSEKVPQALARESAAYREGVMEIKAWANAKYSASTLNPAAEAITRQADSIIQRIEDETEALRQGTLARQLSNNARQIELKYREELARVGNSPEDEVELLRRRGIEIARVNAKTVEGYEAARQWSIGVNQSVHKFIEDATNEARNASALVDGFLKRTEDAVINFARTGKLSFSDLFSFMAEEFLRQQIRMAQASVLAGIGGGGFNSVGDVVDGIGLLFGGKSIGSFANGLGYVPYDGFPATLHEGEIVLTRPEAQAYRNGSGLPSISVGAGQIIQIGQGVSRAEVAQAIAAANRQSEARIQRGLRQGSFA